MFAARLKPGIQGFTSSLKMIIFGAIPKMGMRLTMGKIPKVSGKLKGFSSTAIDFGFGCILVMGNNHVFLWRTCGTNSGGWKPYWTTALSQELLHHHLAAQFIIWSMHFRGFQFNLNPVGFGSIPPVVEPFHIFSQIIYFLVNEHLAIKVFPPLADSATMLPEIVPFKTAKAKKTMLP